MIEFTVDNFANALVSYLANYFPYMNDEEVDRAKHPKRQPLHLIEAIFNNLQMAHTLNTITFDIGSGTLENSHPYYHILEDSEVIHIRGKGTNKSKGSQAKVNDVSARDYGYVKWNGKTFTQEYKKNVRGSRSRSTKARQKGFIVDSEGVVWETKLNPQANYYLNKHYKYIERSIERAIPQLCFEFGLKQKRTMSSGLSEEFALQEKMNSGTDYASDIIGIMNSFMEE